MSDRVQLPPLNALRSFEAVARHRSLRRAAEELLVTPQAVGQQIKLLEDALQVQLLERRGRSIELTEAALLLANYVEAGFREFAEGMRRVSQTKQPSRVNLNVSPYFAARHLMPRLAQFRQMAPDIELRITTMIDLPDFGRDNIDMTIQWGYGGWPDYHSVRLVADPKIICCTPELGKQIATPDDLVRFTLLDTVKSGRLWRDILRFLGVEQAAGDRSVGFDDAASMRRAALQGMGVGLLSTLDAEEDLRSGALVAPLGREALSGMDEKDVPGFYLVIPRSHLRIPGIAMLHRWLQRQDWADRTQP